MKKGKIGNYHCLWLSSFFNHVYKFGGGFPHGSDSKESTCNMGDLGSIPGLGRSLGGGYGNPLQYSCLKNPHGQRSLAGYSSRGHKELYMTEGLTVTFPISPPYHSIQQSHFWVFITKGNGNSISKRYLCSHIHCKVIHSSQDIERNKCSDNG